MPTSSNIIANPTQIPINTGMLLRMPKLTPDAITVILLGPGVTDDEIANITIAMKYSIVCIKIPFASCYVLH